MFIASGTSPRPAHVESKLRWSSEEVIGGVLTSLIASGWLWMKQRRKGVVRKNRERVDSGEVKMTTTMLSENKVGLIG
jgi:hypothetical protein